MARLKIESAWVESNYNPSRGAVARVLQGGGQAGKPAAAKALSIRVSHAANESDVCRSSILANLL